jgi:hypothetical protein
VRYLVLFRKADQEPLRITLPDAVIHSYENFYDADYDKNYVQMWFAKQSAPRPSPPKSNPDAFAARLWYEDPDLLKKVRGISVALRLWAATS